MRDLFVAWHGMVRTSQPEPWSSSISQVHLHTIHSTYRAVSIYMAVTDTPDLCFLALGKETSARTSAVLSSRRRGPSQLEVEVVAAS
jgi:hypothetical protein